MAEPYCAELSLAAGEPLAGTAVSRTDRWIVLEYDQPWAAKAFEQSELPDRVHAQLTALLSEVPGTRIQFIRRPGCEPTGRPSCFLAYTGGDAPHVRKLPIARYEDLLDLELSAWARGELDLGRYEHTEPLYLVCVHGKRDRCCAKLGMPVYQAFADRVPAQVWQTSHLGGHRFAATLLSLPHGIGYGRVEPDEVPALLDAHGRGELHDLGRVRGRTSFDAVAQAAEVAARRELAELGLAAPKLLAVADGEPITVRLGFGDREVEVRLEEQALPPFAPSCGKPPKPGSRLVQVGP